MRAIKEFTQEVIQKILKKLGTTDISGIGDGTITGAISAQNSNLLRISCIEYLKNFTVPTSKTVLDKMYTATKECFVIASINQQLANVTPTFTELSHSSNEMYKKNSGISTATIALHLMPNDYIKITASATTAGVNTFSGTIIVIEK